MSVPSEEGLSLRVLDFFDLIGRKVNHQIQLAIWWLLVAFRIDLAVDLLRLVLPELVSLEHLDQLVQRFGLHRLLGK